MSFSHRAKSTRHLRYAFLCLLVAGLLLAGSGIASAASQTSSEPSLGQTVVTDDHVYAIDYPDGFVTQLAPHLVALGNSQDAMDKAFKSPPVVSSGNVVFQIEYFPPDDQQSAGLDLSSSNALLNSLMKKANLKFGKMESFTLGAIKGSRVSLQEKTYAGTVVSFFLDKTPFVAIVLTAPDEVDQYNDLLDAVVQSIRPSNAPSPNRAEATPVIASIDGVELGQTFTSKDLLVSLDYPDKWIVEANTGTPNLVNLASSKDALDQIAHQSTPKLTSGQTVIQLVYGDVLGRKFPMGLDASTPENLLRGILKNLPWKVGDIQPLTLGQYDAVRVDITDANLSGVFIAVTGGKLPVLAGIFTAPDEASKVEPILDAIVLSVRINGDSTPEPAVTASDAVTLGKTFTSADQQLSLDYPADWLVQSNTTTPNILSLASSQAALDTHAQPKGKLSSGQAVINLFYGIPGMPLPIGLDPIPEHMIGRLLKVMVWKGSDPQAQKLGDYDALRVDFTDLNQNSGVMVAVIKGNIAVLGVIFTAPDEASKVEPILDAIVLSVRLNDGSVPATTPEPAVTKTAPTTSDGVTLDQTFTSSDKSLSIQYPSGWVAKSTTPNSVTLGDSTETVHLLNTESSPVLKSGQVGVQFNYIADTSSSSGLDVSGDPAKFLKSLIAQVPSTVKLGEIETDTLGKLDIARVTLTSDGLDAVVYAFFIGKTPVYAIAGAASGELADFQPTLEAIILSLQIKAPSQK